MQFIRGLLIFCLISNAIALKEALFSQSLISVTFDPFVSLRDVGIPNAYNVDDLIPMVSKISSKFSKMLVTLIHPKQAFSAKMIPSAVALFNKLHRASNQPPMEVSITFPMTVVGNGSTATSFDLAKNIADDANKIYSGTVKRLFLEHWQLSASRKNVEDAKRYFTYIRGQLNETGYILGAYLPFDCGTETTDQLPEYLIQILPFVKEVIFANSPGKEQLNLEPYLTTRPVTWLFEQCKHKIKQHNERISVSLFTAWKFANSAADDRKLVSYWELMNDWAISTNTSIVFGEAFDTPWKTSEWKHSGWWRLIENASYHNSSQYIFEERKNPLKNDTDAKPDENTIPNWLIGVVSAVVIVTLAIIVSAVIWRVLRHKLKSNNINHKDIDSLYTNTSDTRGEGLLDSISASQKAAYDVKMELPKTSFKIERTLVLGSGTFGTVYRGSTKRRNKDCETTVAVKTTNSSSPSAVSGMMSEIKVLSHLGQHENIVNLVGAYTKEVRKGKIYLFLEFCSRGSLEKYLREQIITPANQNWNALRRQGSIKNCIQTFTDGPECQNKLHVDTKNNEGQLENLSDMRDSEIAEPSFYQDLYRWACEIANGMEFLASKNVVHADLATRNVLLTLDKRAKISDFGLSRRLYEYEMYVKKKQEPLPWRWMAPESLRRREFTEKTDVWAFGVTLWEIYSLGDVPFGELSWAPNFVTQLTLGLRLEEPPFSEKGMYTQMLKCWDMDPSKRPSFSDLKLNFQL